MKNNAITDDRFLRRKAEREFERVESIIETNATVFSQGEYQFYKGFLAALSEIIRNDTFYNRYFDLTNKLEDEIERLKS